MSYSIQCVHCNSVLKSPTPIPAGKNVKCPKCKQNFTTPAASRAVSAKTTLASDAVEPPPAVEPEPTPPPEPEPDPAPPADEEELVDPDEDLVDPDEDEVDEVDDVDDVDDVDEDDGEFADIDIEVADDKSRKKNNKNQGNDDDEDEEPRSKKKRSDRDDDDEEADDKPRKKRRERDNDDESPGDDKKPKKKAPPMMLIATVGGGVVLLLMCCVTGIVAALLWSNSKPDIIGRWEQQPGGIIYEFRSDGTGTLTPRGFAGINFASQPFTYTQSGRELSVSTNAAFQIKYDVTRSGNTMQWRPPGAPAAFVGMEFRKLD